MEEILCGICGSSEWRLEEQCYATLDSRLNRLTFAGLSELEAFCEKCGQPAPPTLLEQIEARYHALSQEAG